jgi:hypothetical protein
MTAQTPVYGIKYPVPGEPIRTTRQILEDNAKAVEAALIAGPASPPGASDLAVLSGRVTALEARPWTDLPLVGGNGSLGHDPAAGAPRCQYRIDAGRVWLRGWAVAGNAGVAAGTAVNTPLPAAVRPSIPAEVWALNEGITKRLTLGTDGVFRPVTVIGALQALNLSAASWPLP